MKKGLMILGIIVSIILIFLFSLPFWVDINELVASQVPTIERMINRKVGIGEVRLTVLKGLGAEISQIRVSNQPEGGEETFVSAKSISVGIKLLPLLQGKIKINNVSLIEPSILVQRDATGQFNFDDMLPANEPSSPPGTRTSAKSKNDREKPPQLPGKIEISKIAIQDGSIHFMDAQPRTPVDIRMDNLQVKLRSVSLLQPIKMDIQADLPWQSQKGQFALSGVIGPIGTVPQPETIPIDSVLTLTNIDLLPLSPYLSGLNLQSGILSGRLSARGSIAKTLEIQQDLNWKNLNLKLETSGEKGSAAIPFKADGHWEIQTALRGTPPELTINSNANLDKSELVYGDLLVKPNNIPFNMDLQLEMMEAAYRINHVNLNIDGMQSEASGSFKTGIETFDLDLNFKTNTFSAASLADLSPKVKEALPADLTLPDKMDLSMEVSAVSPDTFDYSAMVDLTKSTFKYGNFFNKSGPLPLTLNTTGKLLKNALNIDNMKLTLGDLNLIASAKIKNFDKPFIKATASIPPADIKDIVAVLPPLMPYQIKGRLDMSADCSGTVTQFANLKGIQAQLHLQKADLILPQTKQKVDRLNAAVAIKDGAIHVSDTALAMGRSSMDITALIKNIQKPRISLTATSPFLDIDALLPASSGDVQTAKTKDQPPEDKIAPKSEKKAASAQTGTRQSAAPDISATGSIRIAKGIYRGAEFRNLLLDFNYEQPLALIKTLKMDIFSGTLQGNGKLNIKDMDNPSWNVNLQSSAIETNSVLQWIAGVKDIITGRFDGNLTLDGKGRQWAVVSKTLSGNGEASIKNGVLTTISLLDALAASLFKTPGTGELARALFPQGTTQKKQTSFKDITAKFDIADAKIKTRNLQLNTSDYILNASGFIGLDQSLDFSAKADLSDTATTSLAQHNIYKYLLDKDGHLMLPFGLKGSIQKPIVQVDARMIENLIKESGKKAVEQKLEKKLEKAAEKLKIKIPGLFE